jgi:circadian clock protein KaiB
VTHRRRPGARTRRVAASTGPAAAPRAGPAPRDATAALRRMASAKADRYVLRLYITGMSPRSREALERVRAFCEERLPGRYDLQVIDIYQLPALAKDEQIVATPTLIRVLPAPLRRFIGNLANLEGFLFGMDLQPRKPQ